MKTMGSGTGRSGRVGAARRAQPQARDRRIRWGRGLLLSTLVTVGACTSSEAPEDPLEGRWTWVEASGGIAGVVLTPASVGYTMTLEYDVVDPGSGQVRVLRDGVLFGTSTVQRAPAGSEPKGELQYQMSVLGMEQQQFRVAADSLVLIDACCDGFTYLFRRSQ